VLSQEVPYRYFIVI